MCPVVIISCFQMMDSIILWSAFLPVKVICPETLLLSSSSFSNDEWWFTDIVLLFVCSFMFVVFDSVVDCSHHSLPSPLLPHRDSAACRKGPLAMAMASLSKTFSESRTRIIGWSVARSVLADDISQTLVKILPDRKLWKCLQRSKTWSALIFDDQLFFFV